MDEATKPAIRFAGFTDAWEQRKVGEVSALRGRIGFRGYKRTDLVASHTGAITFSPSDIDDGGNIDLNNNDYISFDKYDESPEIQVKENDILFTKTASIGKIGFVKELKEKATINPQFALITPNEKIDNYFMFLSLKLDSFTKKVRDIAGGSSIPTMSQEKLKELDFRAPSTDEQQVVGEYFRNFDNLITLHQRKHDKLQNIKKSMLEKLFPKDGADVPEIRFKGFTGAWKRRKVGEVTAELTEYVTFESGFPLLTSSRTGLMFQNEYRGNLSTDNQSTLFSVVPFGACTYRHMSDDDIFHFNINEIVDNGLVSREYPVFVASGENNLYAIIQHLNSSPKFKAFCREQKMGGTRTRLYYQSLCKFEMLLPSGKEQNRIAAFLKDLDNLIALHQRELEKLQNLKKALLEKMFV